MKIAVKRVYKSGVLQVIPKVGLLTTFQGLVDQTVTNSIYDLLFSVKIHRCFCPSFHFEEELNTQDPKGCVTVKNILLRRENRQKRRRTETGHLRCGDFMDLWITLVTGITWIVRSRKCNF